MKDLIQKLESADFSGNEIRIETKKYILILTFPSIWILIELYDQKTLKRLPVSRRLNNKVKGLFKKKEKETGKEKERKKLQ